MANSSFISMAPDIAAVSALVTTVDTVVDAIRAVDVPTLVAEHAALGGVVDAIRAVDVPALAAEHLIIDNEIAVIDGIVDNILVDTDATIPAAIGAIEIRGVLTRYVYNATPGDTVFHDVCNISGSGKLVSFAAQGATTNAVVKVTIDGEASNEKNFAQGAANFIVRTNSSTSFTIDAIEDPKMTNMRMEFRNSLLIQIKQTTGTNHLYAQAIVNVD